MSTLKLNKWQVRLQGIKEIFLLVGVATTEGEFKATTVRTLKEKIKSQLYLDLKPEYMHLLFGDKELKEIQPRGGASTLEHYKIKRLSLLSLIMQVPGNCIRENILRPSDSPTIHTPNDFSTGDYTRYTVPRPSDSLKIHKNNDFSLTFTDEHDCLDPFPPEDTAPCRIKMSCGHAVDASTLYDYSRSLLDSGTYEMRCPAIQLSNKSCDKVWEYAEVRQVALLNDTECLWFESKIGTAAALLCYDLKECPGCRSFIKRQNTMNLRDHCPICTMERGTGYYFCWQCSYEWMGPSESSIKCGREECVHSELVCLQYAPMMELCGCDCPNRRACPNCGCIVEHIGGCKFMICKRCKKEYCFLCLELKADCLKTSPSSWFGKCRKHVAPKQTSIPVWRRT